MTTPGEWGVRILQDGKGAMVVTPPPEVQAAKIEVGDFPFTARRIALLEESAYTPLEECIANAYLMAAAPALLEALLECSERLHVYADQEYGSVTDKGLCQMARAALEKARRH